MEKIITYDDLPRSIGRSIYLRMETDPKLYISLFSKGYHIVNHICDTDESTIYVTGRRQDSDCSNYEEYKKRVSEKVQSLLKRREIEKPKTVNFSYSDLLEHKYSVPFVLKNENQNGGREKFLIQTEEDYENLIQACKFLIDRNLLFYAVGDANDLAHQIDYDRYLDSNFTVQEFIHTPSRYNTTVRLLTSPSKDLLYASLKYKEPERNHDNTTLLGYLLSKVFPLSTKSIVSNTLSGGENILLGEDHYLRAEQELLDSHKIDSDQFRDLVDASLDVHEECESELGLICGFDYIYDEERDKWFLLEYHSRPMVGDYSKRQGIPYQTREDHIRAEGRVRATALSLLLKKTR